MGLGLAIVHSIILEHHGKIHVEDNLPRGAKFVVELPVIDAQA
jgi:two-component system nitrogen regulation sensor histidine kinase NtrY